MYRIYVILNLINLYLAISLVLFNNNLMTFSLPIWDTARFCDCDRISLVYWGKRQIVKHDCGIYPSSHRVSIMWGKSPVICDFIQWLVHCAYIDSIESLDCSVCPHNGGRTPSTSGGTSIVSAGGHVNTWSDQRFFRSNMGNQAVVLFGANP